MAKLKDSMIKQEEHSRIVQANIERDLALDQLVKRSLAKVKHKWAEDMPDLEGQALADAEKQFDYDSWLGKHGYGEATAQDDNPYLFNPTKSKTEWLTPRTMLRLNKIKHGIGE